LEVTFETRPDPQGQRTLATRRLLADLGCIFPFILDEPTLRQLRRQRVPSQPSNYGWLTGCTVRVVMPEFNLAPQLPAYTNARIIRMMRAEGLDGIAGKPFLDLFHWSNGHGGEFCLESWAQYRSCRKQVS